ncbi:hypothetical protein OWK27_00765 [Enterobacter cloacae complex sp. 2022EL-00788]|uniref:hypothetical protein n=1 Tax=Enterobacter cloacae complex TaxID=354276 RepID=UPI0022716075|nr:MULTISPECIES: hypothetical protein [Enterobacter cloacae complex]MCY0771246.1 hypothetical protein [Enterobacter cloacae complex sp. 2022EL-00788]MDX7122355.1 hypothetical protein [Enterobacter hormaechei]
MDTKLNKFMQLAFNNSSANEAAQALKMLAAAMQEQCINPASLLQIKSDSASSVLVAELRRELSILKADYNGMIDRYNTVVRAHKARGEKIAALELSLSENGIAAGQKAAETQQEASFSSEGSIADQIRKMKSGTADLANHPKAKATRRLSDELAAQNEQFKGRWNYQEPSQTSKYGDAHYCYDYGDTLHMWICKSENNDGFSVSIATFGPRGGKKGSTYKSFNDEASLMNWLLKEWGVLK